MSNKNISTLAKTQKRKNFLKKYYKTTITMLTTVMLAVFGSITAFAAPEGGNPSGVSTTTMGSLIDLVLWVVRIAIIIIGVPGIIKIVQGQADENPRDRNAGIATVGIAGACFAATFAIKSLIM